MVMSVSLIQGGNQCKASMNQATSKDRSVPPMQSAHSPLLKENVSSALRGSLFVVVLMPPSTFLRGEFPTSYSFRGFHFLLFV